MQLGIANLAKLCVPPTEDVELPTLDLDIAFDRAEIERSFVQLDDIAETLATVGRVEAFIREKGCTKELIAFVGEDLNSYGITLKEGNVNDALLSLEGFMDDIKSGNIKAILSRIMDAIVRILQKFNDANKIHTNKLDELLRGKLSDITKFDPEHFQGTMGTIFTPEDLNKLTGAFSRIDYRSAVSAKEPTDALQLIINKSIQDVLKIAGYEIKGDSITRIADFSIPRKKMSELGWELGDFKSMVSHTKTMLEHTRAQGGKAGRVLRKEIKAVKEDETAVNTLKAEMKAMLKLITVVERTALVISTQVQAIIKLLKEKK